MNQKMLLIIAVLVVAYIYFKNKKDKENVVIVPSGDAGGAGGAISPDNPNIVTPEDIGMGDILNQQIETYQNRYGNPLNKKDYVGSKTGMRAV